MRERPFYGWVLIAMLSLTTLVSWGATYYAFSVLLTPMRQTFGWSAAQLTGAFSLSLLITSLSDVFVGRWLDARGPRALMTIGSIATTALLIAWSRIDSLAGLYLTLALLGVAGSMVQYSPAFWLATTWFKRRRALALTIITLGGGLASTVFVPLTNTLAQAYGWRDALLWLALIVGATTIAPHALLLRKAPADVRSTVDGEPSAAQTEAPIAASPAALIAPAVLRQPVFWALALAFGLAALAFNGVSVHLLAYEASRGQDPAFAATAAGLSGLMQVIGRLFVVPLGDRLSRQRMLTGLLSLQLASYVSLLALPRDIGLIAHVIFRGIGAGPQSPVRAALLGDWFGTRHFGRVAGQMSFLTGIAGSLSPFLVGAMVDRVGYTPVLWSFVIALVIATITMALIRRHATLHHQ
jgi:MFS family permease